MEMHNVGLTILHKKTDPVVESMGIQAAVKKPDDYTGMKFFELSYFCTVYLSGRGGVER